MAKDEKAKPLTKTELLKILETSKDDQEKRRTRQKLRAMGHRGGLNKPKTAPTPKTKPAAGAAKGRRASAPPANA